MAPSTHHQLARQSPRLLLLDAAITLIAREGLQHLTHRRVEAEAGLTHGSTTYYFRNRETLIRHVITHLAERDQRVVSAALDPTGRPPAAGDPVARAAADLTRIVEAFLTTARDQTVARFELFLHAAREPSLQEELTRWRGLFGRAAEALLGGLGAPDPAESADALVTGIDGLLFAGVCLPGRLTPGRTRQQILALLTRCLRTPGGGGS
ncbi:TetR/AcrR family transcriptional regulator [Streptomyces sp. URMC 129]|uniref:TetR/AcrR family transcriptional regulator n=1 Tax=Streptomyces sp. URMC 129 TaxID=3423407 RepID=UPI003F1ABBD9